MSGCMRRWAVPAMLALFALALVLNLAGTPSRAAGGESLSPVGPRHYYLAMGDSLAFGFQPDVDFAHGFADDLDGALRARGVKALIDLGCPGESSTTFSGRCPYPFLRKYPYIGSQMAAALLFLRQHPGRVSPLTLALGTNDLRRDFDAGRCTVGAHFQADLQALDANLTRTILPQLHDALVVNGRLAGDLVLLNDYDPYENACSPRSVALAQEVNRHLANDVSGFGRIANVFAAFGGAAIPNPRICTLTWICSFFADVHPTVRGYQVMAGAVENALSY